MSTNRYAPDNRESELRVFNIDADSVRKKLEEMHAKKQGILNFKRAVLDVNPVNPNKWIRVRTDGKHTTLAVKERISHTVDGTAEIEIEVSDFDNTMALLLALGNYKPRSIQENTRELFFLNDTEISIDTWPQLRPFLEIEGDNEKIHQISEKLCIDKKDLTAMSVEEYYLHNLGIDVKTTQLKFS